MFRILIRSVINVSKLPTSVILSSKSNLLTITNNEQLILKNYYSVKKAKGKISKFKIKSIYLQSSSFII